LFDVRADVGTTIFGREKVNVNLGDVAFESAAYVNSCAAKVKAKGLAVLLIVRFAGTPESGVEGVVSVA
jgi:3-deoxy-D-arabino-heptulosonate 7-phosphate (DAHP) synthase